MFFSEEVLTFTNNRQLHWCFLIAQLYTTTKYISNYELVKLVVKVCFCCILFVIQYFSSLFLNYSGAKSQK